MAYVELVIKIPEKVYNALTHIEFDANLVTDEMRKSIANGTPLPKGHGALKDTDAILQELSLVSSRPVKSQMYMIEQAETIIEADTESGEEDEQSN